MVRAAVVALLLESPAFADDFKSAWDKTPDRVWVGRDYWANPLNDWRVRDGRLECVNRGGNRNVHLLTRPLGEKKGTLKMSVVLGPVDKRAFVQGGGAAGFRIGVKGPLDDYRSALIRGDGIDAGITSAGMLFIGRPGKAAKVQVGGAAVELRLEISDEGDIKLSAATPGGELLGSVTKRGVADVDLAGHLQALSDRKFQLSPKAVNDKPTPVDLIVQPFDEFAQVLDRTFFEGLILGGSMGG